MNQPWLKAALIGVEQEVSFGIDGAVGLLIDRVAEGDDAALNFIRRAGAWAACDLAAATLDAAEDRLPAPATKDQNELPSGHAWSAAVAAIFASGQLQQSYELRLKYQACRRLNDAGLVHSSALLPKALETAQRVHALRAALLPVLGHRGRWLAAQNPDWKFAAGVDGTDASDDAMRVWQEGNTIDRLAYFKRLRARDARAARELLQASLGELAAKERGELVESLAEALHADDQPLLEPLLKDRSRDVRFAAARLLALLPDSAHAQRLIAWLSPLLTQKRGLLGKSWQIDAPEAADAAWTPALVESTRPQHESLGERAWWLYQLVRQVRLDWWTTQTGMNAKELVTWAGKTDWAAALHRGWGERVGRAEQEWVEALLSLRTTGASLSNSTLLALLPVDRREKYWPNQIDALLKDGLVHDVFSSFGPGETLSLNFSKALFPSLLTCFEDDRLRHDYALRASLLELAALVHPDALTRIGSLPRRADETPAMAECVLAFERIVHLRAALRTLP